MNKVLCPICWHEETLEALRLGQEIRHDDAPSMQWCSPYGGARGQVVTIWDAGYWRCKTCGVSLPPHAAALMIDAVLRVSDPDSDSFDGETFEDAKVAERGGSHL